MDSTGEWIELKNIQSQVKLQEVFDLGVTESHNYFVGETALLVHNKDKPLDHGGSDDGGGDDLFSDGGF